LALAGIGLPLLLTGHLPAVLSGWRWSAVGTFFAQAVTTGFVGRTATEDKGAASGIYLASYFSGDSSARRCLASCSTVSAGALASAALHCRSPLPPRSR
jgi:hypothetical protein